MIVVILSIMADELVEVALITLIEVAEDLLDEAVIDEEIYTSLIAEETQTAVETAIQTSINAGDDDASALGDAYQELTNVSDEAADSWAESMQEKGFDVEGGPQEDPEVEFEDTDPESDPNKVQDEDIQACEDDPESQECLAEKQSRLSRFWEWFKKALGVLGVTGVGVIIGLIVYLLGAILRGLCKLWYIIRGCTPKKPGETQEQCRSDECDTKACQGITNLVQDIRKYFMWIMLVLFTLMVATTIYFKSTTPLWIFGILILFVIAMNTFLGNFLATVVCNFSAVGCLATTGTITCDGS